MNKRLIVLTTALGLMFSQTVIGQNPAISEKALQEMKSKLKKSSAQQKSQAELEKQMKAPVTNCEHLRIKQVKNTKLVCFMRMRFNQPITKEKYVKCAEHYLNALIKDGNLYAYPNMIKLYTREKMPEKAKKASAEFDKIKPNLEFKKYPECFTDKDI